MNDLSAEYWNNRYVNNQFGWDIGYVSTPLKEYIHQLQNKDISILIPGAGNGYEAQLLFELGFKNVYVLDFAQAPLENIKKRMPDFPDKQLLKSDFFECTGKYDLIIEQTFFCALDPSLRKSYAEQMHRLLKPDGKVVGLFFNEAMNTDQPPFGGSEDEYRELFSKRFDIKVIELCYNSIKPRMGKELFVIIQVKSQR